MHWVSNRMTSDKTRIVRQGYDRALLVLVGLGSMGANWNAILHCFDHILMDIYVPDFIARPSLKACRDNLATFIDQYALSTYRELHVFAYILGGTVLNHYLIEQPLPNLRSIIYDRSPWQERAPQVIAQTAPRLARIAVGQVILDLAQTEYLPCTYQHITRALCIETRRTALMHLFARRARKLATIQWQPSAYQQPHDDYCYIPLNHTQMYSRLDQYATLLHHFYEHGTFPTIANRTPPQE